MKSNLDSTKRDKVLQLNQKATTCKIDRTYEPTILLRQDKTTQLGKKKKKTDRPFYLKNFRAFPNQNFQPKDLSADFPGKEFSGVMNFGLHFITLEPVRVYNMYDLVGENVEEYFIQEKNRLRNRRTFIHEFNHKISWNDER